MMCGITLSRLEFAHRVSRRKFDAFFFIGLGSRASFVPLSSTAIARSEQGIREADLTIIDARTRFLSEVVTNLQQQQAEIADLSEQLAAANDTISRNRIIAPVAGTVRSSPPAGSFLRPSQSWTSYPQTIAC